MTISIYLNECRDLTINIKRISVSVARAVSYLETESRDVTSRDVTDRCDEHAE